MAKFLFVLVIVAVLLSACGSNGKPQPVCTNTQTAVVDSVSANNPFGICKDTAGNLVAGQKSFAQYFEAAKKAVEQTAQCYDKTGMGTTCLSQTVNSISK